MSQSQKTLDAASRWSLLLSWLPLLLLLGFTSLPSAESLVVPQELPSLLSLIYSNIPPIKKGTDSRLGFGFRLGDHADFQVLLELGPQKETQPIGDQDGKSSFSKRQVNRKELLKTLLRQQQQQQLDNLQQQNPGVSTEHTASSWLQSWSQDMNNETEKKPTKSHNKRKSAQSDKKPVLPTPPAMAEQAFKQLQVLYQMATTTTTTTTTETTTAVTATTSTTPKPFVNLDLLNLRSSASFNARPEQLQEPHLPPERKSKDEITAELMDVSLEDER